MTSPMFTRGFSFGMSMTLGTEGVSLVTNSRGCKGESAERDAKLLTGVRAVEESKRRSCESAFCDESVGFSQRQQDAGVTGAEMRGANRAGQLCVAATVAGCCRRNSSRVS